jgi:hypothetical protein
MPRPYRLNVCISSYSAVAGVRVKAHKPQAPVTVGAQRADSTFFLGDAADICGKIHSNPTEITVLKVVIVTVIKRWRDKYVITKHCKH